MKRRRMERMLRRSNVEAASSGSRAKLPNLPINRSFIDFYRVVEQGREEKV
jgi:hypothetical protein